MQKPEDTDQAPGRMSELDPFLEVSEHLLYVSAAFSGHLPKFFWRNGTMWQRFLDRIYCPASPLELPQPQVIEVCDLRLAHYDDVLDHDFHDTLVQETCLLASRFAPNCKVVVDFGCGSGSAGHELERLLPEAVLLYMDPSPYAAKQVRLVNTRSTVLVIQPGSVPLKGDSIDLFVATFVFHFETTWPAIQGIGGALKAGGFLVCTYYGNSLDRFLRICAASGLLLREIVTHPSTGSLHHLLALQVPV